MNTWLVGASAALAAISAVHSVMGERLIFQSWRWATPREVPRRHQVILRASWHLPSLLGLGQAVALAVVATADGAPPWPMVVGALGLGVGACGALVAAATRGRHHGGTALMAAAALIGLGISQAGGA